MLQLTEVAAPTLAALDALLVGALQRPVALAEQQARETLAASGEPFGWAVVDAGATAFPPGIESAWVFVIAPGTQPEAHRHPNSVQHLRSLRGEGRVGLFSQGSSVRETWMLGQASPWLVIGQDVFHEVACTTDAAWVVVSFHTVPAGELLEVTASGVRHYA
ncbi:MAG TPA: hypothetical protein VHS99_23480 [Chloroflexota bacterium]|jgi:oxalate decarboxylase/phosphoglucose isomerase-like protein (cupin superfamily)|nr:hypothetical protein [Chloroflexota bacterium]